jgi:hypothetical protein
MPSLRLTALALLAAIPAARASDCEPELFRIARSANANVVVYLANLAEDGRLDPQRPARAEWILLADRGQREPLTPLEEALAYGFDARPADPLEGYWVALRSGADRPIRVHLHDGCPRATVRIAGREARLRLVFVETAAGFILPRVRSVELEGQDLGTGEPVRELVPGR